MNVSKTLSSAAAAATIIGAVGLAYAHSASDAGTPAADSRTTSTPAPSPEATTPSDDSTSSSMPQTTPSTTDSSDTSVAAPPSDLQPKPDRN